MKNTVKRILNLIIIFLVFGFPLFYPFILIAFFRDKKERDFLILSTIGFIIWMSIILLTI